MISQSGSRYSFLAVVIIISFLVVSCRQVDVFEKNTTIPHYNWQHNYTVSGSFIIKDTSAAYNIYIVLRHTDAYQYNNIWLKTGLQAPGDTMFFQNINLTLASDATGWEGTGMNDIWEVRKLLNGRPKQFKKSGEYKFTINQIMRDNPLAGIMSAGMRVQKAN
jgi:gliding motility-associated lipoprotein GldH